MTDLKDEGVEMGVEGGVDEIRSVFDNLSYKGKIKALVGSLLLLFVLFIIAVVQGSAAQSEFKDTYTPTSSMPSDFDARCRLIQGDTFNFVNLYGAKWFARGTATKLTTGYSAGTDSTLSPAAGTAATAPVTLTGMAGKQMYGLSFNREYTIYGDNTHSTGTLVNGDNIPNSQIYQGSSQNAAFHGPTFRTLSKAQLEQTTITFKQAVETRDTTGGKFGWQFSYQVFAGETVPTNTAEQIGLIVPDEYSSDLTECTAFDLETLITYKDDTGVITTNNYLSISTSGNDVIDQITFDSDGSKIWELAGGIECKPSSGQNFTNGFQITMAWLVFIVSAMKAYWLTSKWSLLMKNKGYFRAKGAAFAEQLIHELV